MANSIMKLCVLIENTSDDEELTAEHGLSIMVWFNKRQYLIDAGTSGNCVDNASKLKVNLKDIDKAFLSHGHYDHAGGLRRVFEENPKLNVYCGKGAKGNQYSGKGGMHYIGIPQSIIEMYSERFLECDSFKEIENGVYVVPHANYLQETIRNISCRTQMYVMKNEGYEYDNFEHEISIVFDTDKGLVIFNSCSHGGLINIVNEVKNVLKSRPVYAYIGGLHMKTMCDGKESCMFSDEEIKNMCAFIEEQDIKRVITGHCTGEVAYNKVKKYLGNRLDELKTGKFYSL